MAKKELVPPGGQPPPGQIGSVASVWRYPVKSMMGGELETAAFSQGGLLGDRSYALQDVETGRVVSAKNVKKFGKLLEFGVSFVEPPVPGESVPAIMFSFPDGALARSDDPDLEAILSEEVGFPVRLLRSAQENQGYDEYWPDIDGMKHRDEFTTQSLPSGSFYDSSPVHIITTSTMARLGELYPQGRFEPRRFRPNLVVETQPGLKEFAENNWPGRELRIGGTRLRVTKLCGRCVETTLRQADLPLDLGILRTALSGNRANVGAYATVEQPGTVSKGDPVWLI